MPFFFILTFVISRAERSAFPSPSNPHRLLPLAEYNMSSTRINILSRLPAPQAALLHTHTYITEGRGPPVTKGDKLFPVFNAHKQQRLHVNANITSLPRGRGGVSRMRHNSDPAVCRPALRGI